MMHLSVNPFRHTIPARNIAFRFGWWLAAAAMFTLVAALTIVIRRSELLPGEASVSDWLAIEIGWPGEALVDLLDYISEETIAPFLFVGALISIWRLWGRYPAGLLGLAGLMTAATKISDLADRPRPTAEIEWNFAYTGTGGFPSQHVIYAVLVFGLIAFFSLTYIERPLLRRAAVALFGGIVVMMGPSRVIDGEHWPADVIGGYLIGLPLLFGLIWLHPRLLPVLRARAPWLYRLAGADLAANRTLSRPLKK